MKQFFEFLEIAVMVAIGIVVIVVYFGGVGIMMHLSSMAWEAHPLLGALSWFITATLAISVLVYGLTRK